MPAKRFLIVLLLVLAGVAAWTVRSMASPREIAPTEMGAFGFAPGELVADFRFASLAGEEGRLSDLLEDHRAVVVVIRSVDCPVAQKYGHEVARLEKEYASKGVAFLYVDVNSADSRDAMRAEIETFGFTGPYVADPEARIGRTLQVAVSTEVFVIDDARTLRYRGAVDDQYGITFAKPAPRQVWLRDALDAVVADRRVEVPSTEASGCYIELAGAPGVPARDVTYHSRVSRILQDNCATCHRTGGVAPFSLESYTNASGYRGMIRFMVEEGRMPPWFANPAHGEWKNDRTLSDRNKRDLLAWIDAGAPEGDPSTAVRPVAWVDGWQLEEEPDAVIQIPEPFRVPAEGVVDYQYVYVKTDFPEDRWITKIEARPTQPQVTHHIIAYLDEPDDDPDQGVWLGATAPGVPPNEFPQGTGKLLPKGAWIKFELHYTPNGTAVDDQSMIGVVFADAKPEREIVLAAAGNTDFEIPAGAPNHEVVAEMEFSRGGIITAFLPHLHLRGKAFRYELVRPDGTEEILLDIPRYDFNWQLTYEPKEPIRVEPGDILRGRAWYDNSADNPANPDPTLPVRYGEQSFEEMMFGFFDWIPDQRRRSGED
jgi:mono/diheme cytochrome c family protein/peroxiredoxin